MAKNITLLGASYSDVPAVNLPQTGGGTARFTDTSVTTAVESDVASGKIFIKADGSQATGTGSGGGGGGCDVTQDENGFIVLPEEGGGGGGSSWTLLDSTEVEVSNPSTTATSVYVFTIPSAVTSDKMIFVRIRDKAGPRTSHYIGSDTFLMNYRPANGSSAAFSVATILSYQVDSTGNYNTQAPSITNRVGLYATGIGVGGIITIYARNGDVQTIDGTFLVEVFALDYSDGLSPFTYGA